MLHFAFGTQGGPSWELAKSDGWVPGKTLLPIAEAAKKGTVVMYLLSDAGQKASWDVVKPHLTKGKSLYVRPSPCAHTGVTCKLARNFIEVSHDYQGSQHCQHESCDAVISGCSLSLYLFICICVSILTSSRLFF